MNTSFVQLNPAHPDHIRKLDASGLMAYHNKLCDRIEHLENKMHILVPGTYDRQRILAQIHRLLETYPHLDERPPLFGLPVGVKDIFRCDGFQTGCGSLLPPALFDGPEATCVTRLKSAGAVVAGKTITTEFAYFEPGPTRNPWNLDHTPGGSSSGSAAGVAAGFFPWALGSQTIGSVIRPAAFCGIMGFKPSLGCIPTNGVIPFSETVDHVGLFAGSLEGLDDLMAVLNPDWQAAKPSPGMEDVTLAVPVGPYMEQTDPAGRTYFDQSLQRLKAAGIEIKEIPLLEDIDAINDRHQRLIAIELAQVHESWFENYGHLYRPKTVAFIEKGRRLAGEDVDSLKSSCLKLRQRLTDQMHSHNIAAWICPSTLGEAPAGLAGTGSPLMNLPWTHAGMPVISLPSGKGPQGLPLGIQLVGEFMQDPALVGTATQLVKALPK